MKKSGRFTGVYSNKKKNGDVSYYITYRDIGNSFKRVKVGDKSKGITEIECNQIRNEILNKVRLGDNAPVIRNKVQKSFTFGECYSAYIDWAKHNKETWEKDAEYYRLHLYVLEDEPLKSLRAADFEQLKISMLEKGYKQSSVRHYIGAARHAINHAIRNELIKNYTNPIGGGLVRLPTGNNAKLGFLTKEQAQLLLNNLSGLAYQLSVILLHTGARFGEVVSLYWRDINFDTRLAYFKATKDGNARHVYLSDLALEVLQSLNKSKSPNTLVFTTKNNTPVKFMPNSWQRTCDKLFKENADAGKYRITPHSLRHTHASWLAIAGVDILSIKDQLGHKSIKTTMRYAHLISDKRHEATREIFS